MEKNEANIEMGDTSRESKGKAPLLAATVAAAAHNRGKAGYKRGPALFDVVLRMCAAAAALGAAVAMATTQQTLPFFTQFFQFQASYDDIPTYTFFVIAMAIVTGYLFLSVPFSIVCIARPSLVGPRLLLIICDTVALTICTAAGGSAAAIDYLAHNGNSDANWLAICQQFGDFCQRASGAVVGSLITAVLLVFLVVISAVALRKH